MANTAQEVWQLLGELVAAQKETERILKEESQKTDQQIQQLSLEIQQLSLESQKTDHQIQQLSLESQKTDRQIQQLSREVGNLGGKWGRFVENMVAPACETIFQSRNIPVHRVAQRVKGRLNGKILEIDVLVSNENYVLAVEVKSSLSVEDVKEFIKDLREFRQFFPEYNEKQLYGAVAGIEMEKGADKYAYRQGLFVLAQSGETIRILNDDKFQPQVW